MPKHTKHINDKSNYPSTDKLNKKYSHNRDETLGEMLVKRNYQLILFFQRIYPNLVELYGKAESPMIVLDRKIKLNAFVRNFKLNFTNGKYMNTETIYSSSIGVNASLPPFTIEEFIKDYEQEDWGETVSRLLGKKAVLENQLKK